MYLTVELFYAGSRLVRKMQVYLSLLSAVKQSKGALSGKFLHSYVKYLVKNKKESSVKEERFFRKKKSSGYNIGTGI